MNKPFIIVSGYETPATLTAMEQGVIDRCCAHGCDCLLIPHIYHLSDACRVWRRLSAHVKDTVLFCWLHPRAAQWILQRHQVDGSRWTIVNLAAFADGGAAVRAAFDCTGSASPGAVERLNGTTRERWYPVLDASRCINCQHCLQFCLFGVYELNAEGQVSVKHPDQCKPGCPACSRICPQSAIMFPLYEKDAAIAGSSDHFVVVDAAARRMFYARTQRPCPVCGRKVDPKSRKPNAKGEPCPECGQPQPAPPHATTSTQPLPFDDLDDLVDQLDRQMQGRR